MLKNVWNKYLDSSNNWKRQRIKGTGEL